MDFPDIFTSSFTYEKLIPDVLIYIRHSPFFGASLPKFSICYNEKVFFIYQISQTLEISHIRQLINLYNSAI